MDLTDVVHQFEIWNEGVQRAVFNSPEFKKIVNTDMIEYEIEEAKAKVAKKYAYLALDDKYKTEVSCIDNVLPPPMNGSKRMQLVKKKLLGISKNQNCHSNQR